MTEPWYLRPVASIDEAAEQAARDRQGQLTKPPGSLGRLEEVAVRLAAWQGAPKPALDRVWISVFAGDHGVAAEGVSAFPQAVTTEMIRNFSRGGAAVSVLAREAGANLEVVDLGAVEDPGSLPGVRPARIAPGTGNLRREPAMTAEELAAALAAGAEAARRAEAEGAQLFIGGEMGIANTTAATAVACGLTGDSPEALAGPGTGLDARGVDHKAAVVRDALGLHAPDPANPAEALRRVGGFEIAGLAGAFVAAAQRGIPVLVDGFIATTAALAAVRLNPGVADWLAFGHRSAEPGHAAVLAELGAAPLLDLDMRLGEGSGAAAAVPLLRQAVTLHNRMATFEEAGIPS
ncbi:nicotinate-nucleotide--dimethylbenzimidazole phosphoribosyltransferase [Thiohalorhabdus denitrificans]|uniref:Nicotinate-nucleotide--dimethylbenzimidazole phosphoribosyltransferase n=1 Tax=Thiohalorhabdus denitrificans TaxID=381306 RepID=A0A0P9C329_9GAMM|nr:nicotinate-nucleotide--dimethylbenzimidazole phosphoribosyltransferase [Thiohalorhabdus denitrificans]KPV39059.1 nicotinate-nucleotide--dimethylbenzimidazole phosphoribosyltransferase [Thiohalorhabdus denitrificans]SCX78731.1 nicotinate-nucleotide-dimethylbenzimidazole phosphoribosyltransferase [Thiohalorhabdus denitrificans]